MPGNPNPGIIQPTLTADEVDLILAYRAYQDAAAAHARLVEERQLRDSALNDAEIELSKKENVFSQLMRPKQ